MTSQYFLILWGQRPQNTHEQLETAREQPRFLGVDLCVRFREPVPAGYLSELIFLDIQLPDLNGFEVLNYLEKPHATLKMSRSFKNNLVRLF